VDRSKGFHVIGLCMGPNGFDVGVCDDDIGVGLLEFSIVLCCLVRPNVMLKRIEFYFGSKKDSIIRPQVL
jgi:hypothetical protein